MNTDQILFTAGRLRRMPVDTRDLDSFQVRESIVLKLIEMRKSGLLRAVYCDADKLRVALPGGERLPVGQSITWSHALDMVQEFDRQRASERVERKPPTRAGISGEAKTKCR